MKDHILLLGGGFIGHALAKQLVKQGNSVTIVTRTLPVHPTPGINWRLGRLDDPTLMEPLLSECHAVVHTASTSTPGDHANEPVLEAEENLVPLLRLLEMIDRHAHVPLTYLSSGGAIYGNPASLPVSEDHKPAPLSYHAAGKASAEQFLNVFAHRGHKVTILRPSNVYGPYQTRKPGFGVIRTLLDHVRHGNAMTIWGNGETIRDYLYIDDLVTACLMVLDKPESGIFNVGSGQGLSLNALCELAEEITGCRLERRYEPARIVDVKEIVLDTAAIRDVYGWLPTVTIEQGIKATWQWLQECP